MTDLPGHDRKVTSDKKLIYVSLISLSHFSVTFNTTGKLLIAFVILTLGKKGVDGFTGRRQKSDNRYEFDLKLVLKSLRCK